MVGITYDDAKMAPLIARALAGENMTAIAYEQGIHPQTMHKYVRLARAGKAKPIAEKKPLNITIPKDIAVHVRQPVTYGHTVLAIPDLHCPFEHPDALAFLIAVRDKYKPTQVVCLGDEVDFCAFSRFPRDPDGMSPGGELQAAIDHLIPFYREFPNVKVVTSNHTVRMYKMGFLAGLPQAFFPSYAMLLNAPDGWSWSDYVETDGVRYFHGEGKSGQNAHLQFLKAYKKSVVIGHIHSYAAVSHEGHLFAVNSGCLIDGDAYAFKYAKHMPIPVSLGCSIIFEGKSAVFIPLITDASGRWVGKL